MTIYSIHTTGLRWEYLCLIAGTILILLDVFWDREFNPLVFYVLMALLFIIPLYSSFSEPIMKAWASIPICYIIFLGMYVLNIVRGGADVKCLIVLSIMFPIYPQFFGFPLINVPEAAMSQIFVYSISVLFLAAILAIPVIFYFMFRNIRDRNISKRMFSGHMMLISDAEGADVWPLEDIVDGELSHIKIPDEEEIDGIYTRLKEAGHEKVWVTPMIPFIVMITAAVAILTLIGNPLFLIV